MWGLIRVNKKALGSSLVIGSTGLSHDSEMYAPKTLGFPNTPPFSLIIVRVAPLLSHRLWNSSAANPSLPRISTITTEEYNYRDAL